MPLVNQAFSDTTDNLQSNMQSGENLPLDPFDLNLNATALAWYGYVGDTAGKLYEGNPSNSPYDHETANRPTGQTVSGPITHNAIGHQNPLFWFLIVALLFVGYLGFGFDFK